ncbi:O-methyltransferase [Metabacillus halosaccharovorans]|uniref:tRNA 5-hydroxyuridine methyltransferase n=1 Tax=Metabacillus halosaccharovorans TaxID=930124 RepID=A0ABT3DE86_9BACI|nr:O-methyltransferase [Metabacillus halosaccharovorans]MCV9885279.1 O-methyltransferase [Metabacillus halosaccharovorans]
MLDHDVITYVENLIPESSPYVKQMEEFAKQHEVPIMEKVGIEVLLLLLSMQQPKRIFEIGTAIGYSAIRMATHLPQTQIVTVELDEERYHQANKHIHELGLENRIKTFLGDALSISEEVKQYGPFDALFIDATKAKYKKFFALYEPMLAEDGIIYSDNVLFKGTVARDRSELKTRRQRTLVRKLDEYNQMLSTLEGYKTTIIPVGDGIAVTKKMK